MSITISTFEFENVKRIKAVSMTPSATGLTVIGGKNNQGKTSVLDAIAWALGGDKFRPTDATRDGSLIPPHLKVTLSNGIVVERRGKNSDLKVTDPAGNLAGQALLNKFVSAFALDLPKFLQASDKEKAQTLLQILGIGDQLFLLEKEEQAFYNERTQIGRIADQKKAYADGLISYPDAPEEPVSAADLIAAQQEILARNGQRQQWKQEYDQILAKIAFKKEAIEAAKKKIAEIQADLAELEKQEKAVQHTPAEMKMESTEELEAQLRDVEAINAKVAENRRKSLAEDEAENYRAQYADLTKKVEDIRRKKLDLLNGAKLPLPGLGVENGILVYNGRQWDCMSGSEQLRVATAIVRKLNPECGFVLLDKLEQMDADTLAEFGDWLKAEGLQAIATRVSTGGECSIIIADGYAEEPKTVPAFTGWGK